PQVQPAPVHVPPRPSARTPEAPTRQPAWAIAAAVIASSIALMCAVFPRLAPLVLPFAGLGLPAAGYTPVLALPSDRSLNYPAAAPAYGVLALGLAAVFPGCLGPRYFDYRQPHADAEVVRAIPRAGVPADEEPKNPDGADASRFALQRKNILIEVQW